MKYLQLEETSGLTVIAIGNGHGKPSSNPGGDVSVPTNVFVKDMNSYVLLLLHQWLNSWIYFVHSEATSQGEGKT